VYFLCKPAIPPYRFIFLTQPRQFVWDLVYFFDGEPSVFGNVLCDFRLFLYYLEAFLGERCETTGVPNLHRVSLRARINRTTLAKYSAPWLAGWLASTCSAELCLLQFLLSQLVSLCFDILHFSNIVLWGDKT
jgi:hypothetical protein